MADLLTSQEFPSVALVILDSQVPPQPARVDGVPVWATSDATVVSVVVAADGMSAVVAAVAPGGPARITVTADADLGPGVTTITGVSEDINVTQDPAGLASVMTLALGTPQPKA